jgi:hypothetical protein
MATLRFASPQEEKADRFVAARLVTIGSVQRRDGRRTVTGEVMDNGKVQKPAIGVDDDDRLVEARCDCGFYGHNRLTRGPCEHMLALRRLFHHQLEGKPAGEAA